MERSLTEKELEKINELCETEIWLLTKYANLAKVLSPITTVVVFLVLYFDVSLGSIWIYLGISLILSIIEVIIISKYQKPWLRIKSNDCLAIETKMVSNRKSIIGSSNKVKTFPGDVRHYRYFVTVEIEGKLKEIEYRGKEFDYLKIGEEMLVIKGKDLKNVDEYICFSKKEIEK